MSCEDGYVLVGEGVEAEGINFGDDEASMQNVTEHVTEKEVMIFLDREEYENEVREGFESGRAAIWKQFVVDLDRQVLNLGGELVSKLSPADVVCGMERLLRSCLLKRSNKKAELKGKQTPNSDPLHSGPTVDNGYLLVAPTDVGRHATLPDPTALLSLLSWISSFASSPLGYLLTPLSAFYPAQQEAPRALFSFTPETDCEVTKSNELRKLDMIVSRMVIATPIVDGGTEWEEVALETHKARGGAPKPLSRPSGTTSVPKQTPQNADVIDKVDTLAMFCQQGCLAIVCKMVSSLYAPFDLGFYALDSADCGPVAIDIDECTNDYGHPDVHISIKKCLKISRIVETGQVHIGFVKAAISLMLFSEQQVSMVLVGVPKVE